MRQPRSYLLVLLALGSLLCAGQQKRKKPKPPEVEVISIAVHRSEGLVTIDGRVRNCGERGIAGLTLLFEMQAPGKEVVTRQRGKIDEEVLEPGAEAEFRWQMRDPVRAVSVLVLAVDGSGNELTVRKAGPYPVE